jgi:hypothetical protein
VDANATPPQVERRTIHELAAHIAAADASRFVCARADDLRELLEAPFEALATLKKTLNKRGGNLKTDKCVGFLAESAAQMRSAAERILAKRTGRGGDGGEELNCLCQQV